MAFIDNYNEVEIGVHNDSILSKICEIECTIEWNILDFNLIVRQTMLIINIRRYYKCHTRGRQIILYVYNHIPI